MTFAEKLLPYVSSDFNCVEVGSRYINGSIRSIIESHVSTYVGVDKEKGRCVDIVLDVENLSEHFDCSSLDLVCSTEMLEHVKDWRRAIVEMIACVKPGGLLFLTTRSPGFPLHNYPEDHWRFSKSDFISIFSFCCDILEISIDQTLGYPCGIGIIAQKQKTCIDEFNNYLKTIQVSQPADKGKPKMDSTELRTLDDYGRTYNTDKASQRNGPDGKQCSGHNFLEIYEEFLEPYKERTITILELGVGPKWNLGASLKLWHAYFQNAKIVGVDNKLESKALESDRVKIEVGNLANIGFLNQLQSTYNPDLIIDDASHVWAHQILALQYLFPTLREDGLYIIEDVHTSFGHLRKNFCGKGRCKDLYHYISQLNALVCGKGATNPLIDDDTLSPFQEYIYPSIKYIVTLPEAVILRKAKP